MEGKRGSRDPARVDESQLCRAFRRRNAAVGRHFAEDPSIETPDSNPSLEWDKSLADENLQKLRERGLAWTDLVFISGIIARAASHP